MNDFSYIQVGVALIAVLALLLVVAWLLKHVSGGRLSARGQRRLSIQEIAVVDPKRRLVLVRRDETEHLILIGGPNDLLLETGSVLGPLPDATTEEPFVRSPSARTSTPRSGVHSAAPQPAAPGYQLPPVLTPQPPVPPRNEPSFGQHLKDRL